MMLATATLPSNTLPQWAHRIKLGHAPATLNDLQRLKPTVSDVPTEDQIHALAKSWLDAWRSRSGSPAAAEFLRSAEPARRLSVWIRLHPSAAWSCILGILRTKPDPEERALVGAGPLEDLLTLHGPRLISEVEEEAIVNSLFLETLTGVWRSGISESIWMRLQQAIYAGRVTARTKRR